jgi:hypothetical protein
MTFPAKAGGRAVPSGRRGGRPMARAGPSGSGRPVGRAGSPYGRAVRRSPDEVLGVG